MEGTEVTDMRGALCVLLVGGVHQVLPQAQQHLVLGQPHQVIDISQLCVERLEHLQEAWFGEGRVRSHDNPHLGKTALEGLDEPAQHALSTPRGVDIAGAQQSANQLAALPIKNQQRVVHVLVVVSVEEGQLLLPVGRVIRRIDVQHHHLGRLREGVHVVLLEQPEHSTHAQAVHRVLHAREGWLRGQGGVPLGQSVAGHPQSRIVAQRVGVVAVLVTQGNLVDALAQLLQTRVLDAVGVARIRDAGGHPAQQLQPLVHLPQQQGPTVAGGLRCIKREVDGKNGVKREGGCGTLCHAGVGSSGGLSLRQTQAKSGIYARNPPSSASSRE